MTPSTSSFFLATSNASPRPFPMIKLNLATSFAMTTFHIEQFGCRATHADGAAIERQLRDRGYSAATDASAAEFVVLNTCTVTAAADTQARDAIRKIHAANPEARIIVTGCYAQRAPEDLASLPGVSYVVGNSHKPQIPSLVTAIRDTTNYNTTSELFPLSNLTKLSSRPETRAVSGSEWRDHGKQACPTASILTGDIFALSDVLVAPVLGGEGNHTRPTLKIQDGCNSRCSFCVIPFVRGKSRSLPVVTVLGEIQRLSDSGYKEIVLSGINLGTYGRDLSPRIEFLDLLNRILDETNVERLRISSIEPLDVTRDLVALFGSTARLAPHFHMPLQSASNHILAAMHRWYRAEHYARRVEFIRELLPHAAIGADIITGFPGETEEDHSITLRFIEGLPFTYLHIFSYSQRPGTKAAALPNQLSGAVIKRRARELRALAETKSSEFRMSQIGRELRVLTLRRGLNSSPEITPAISDNYLNVRIPAALPPNQFFSATITDFDGGNLLASPLQPACIGAEGAD
jgi:threonylcarbamoyladenosine tRNA methylthiotransferase MtaB